jgi:hypothetical protein
MNWTSVKAHHVAQACEALFKSTRPKAKSRGLVVTYKDQQLPVKMVLRLAYCLANDIWTETYIDFASGESTLNLLRSLGFHAERLQGNHSAAEKD